MSKHRFTPTTKTIHNAMKLTTITAVAAVSLSAIACLKTEQKVKTTPDAEKPAAAAPAAPAAAAPAAPDTAAPTAPEEVAPAPEPVEEPAPQ
jgi:hypothetical protein